MSKFSIYNSSAGSGKTFALVREYLKIALETKDAHQYRHILAITFTNKAASEMKERIISSLKALSSEEPISGTPKFLQAELVLPITEGGLGIDQTELKERSKNVLKSILHNYNDFGVSTIDKFTHKIIRTFAHDLQLPLNFDIELDDNEVLGGAIDMLIAEVGTNEKLTKLLLEYTSRKADAEENWHIERDLFEFAKNLIKEDGELYLEKIRNLKLSDFENIKNQLHQEAATFESKVKSIGKEGLEFIKQQGIEPKAFYRGYFYAYFHDLLVFKKLEPNNTLINIIKGENAWYAKSCAEDQKQLIDLHQDAFVNLFNKSRTYLNEFESNYRVNKLIIRNLYNLALLNEIEKTVVEFKHDNNVLSISDFNKKIASIVESEPIPFIYERLGEKYNHYLIDEFQDTSIIQWHNIIPLVDNSLASGHFNMVVGDAKQAIYRFRGGEVEQIINLPKIYKHNKNPLLLEREAALDRYHHYEYLNKNYRSKAEVVQFNNEFFQSVSNNLSNNYQKLYEDLAQEYDANNTGGGVEIKFIEEIDNEIDRITILNYIFKLIQTNLDAGYALNDIAILTRNKNDGADIAADLLNRNINVISSESLLLNSSDEVNFLIAVLSFLSNPTDKHFQVQVLNYLTQNIYQEDLLNVFNTDAGNPVIAYLGSKNIHISFKTIANYSLYELVEHLISKFELDKGLDVYVQFFLDKIHEYASRYDNSVINFLEWWTSKSDKFSIVVPDGVDAVKIMTIHKSKGLEFPVVIYPFASSKVKQGEKFFWTNDTKIPELKAAIIPIKEELTQTDFNEVYDEEMEKSRLDLINMVYVALTRPKERLYVVSKKNKNSTKHGSVSEYLYDYCQQQADEANEEDCYRFGLFLPKEKDLTKEISNDKLFELVAYNNWREKIQISYQAPKIWETDNPTAIGEYGTLIHNILSKIDVKEDLEGVLTTYERKGLIHSLDRNKIKENLDQLFNIEGVSNLFNHVDELKNERSILLPSGEVYQPDRVVVKGDQTFVVDYKTGEQKEDHKNQITNYKNLLVEMGYKNVSAQLLYIKDKLLSQV